ncbi:MAG: SAP domain-containing protein [Candidatus Poseidoniales archaeon]
MDSDQENQATTASEDNPSSNNSESSVDTQEDFSKFSVDELKSKLKEAGLPVSGKKAELVERLESSTSEKSDADSEEDSETDKDSQVTDEDSEKADAKPVFTLEELEQLSRSQLRKIRKDYHHKAEELRVARDELNLTSQTHAAERNELNVKAKEYMDEVHMYRDRRNGLNVEVGQIRDERNEVTEKVNSLKDNFLSLKRKRFSGQNLPPISRLRKQIQELEIKQMTTPLTTDKERALVEEISSLQNKIKQHDDLIETDTEVLDARDTFRESENKRRELSKSMQKSRQEAQTAHHSMKDSLRLNRSTRRKADAAQRAFVKAKEKADIVHNEYIEYLRGMQEIDRMTASQGKSGSLADQKASAASAEDLFAKFLAGEKLSTEQLMIIQKAGML